MSARIPWVALGVLLGAGGGGILVHRAGPGLLHLPPCRFKAITGLACASCGLTRWALALGQGDWAGAFHWHPVATLLLLAGPLAVIWDLRRALARRPYPALPDSRAARLTVAGLLLLAWLTQAVRGI